MKVKNCPWCDEIPRLDWFSLPSDGRDLTFHVWCDDGCGMSGPHGENKEEAIERWNELPRKEKE